MNDFTKSTDDLEVSYIILPNLFEKQKAFILIEIQFCDRDGKKLKDCNRKFHEFTSKLISVK